MIAWSAAQLIASLKGAVGDLDKVTRIVNTPPVSGGFGDDEPVPPGLVIVTAFEAHCDARFHELEDLPSISNIAERPPPFKWMD